MDTLQPSQRTATASTQISLWRGEIMAALARVLDYCPRPQVPHHGRVAVLSAKMASNLRCVDRLDAFYAALIHDIGLLDNTCDPDRYWSPEEQANLPAVRMHPLIGAQLAAEAPGLFSVAPLIMDHHECYDGHGYPRGKGGDEISVGAQVLRFSATCDGVLREQGSPELLPLLDALRSRAASQVCAEIVNTGIEVLGEPGFYAQLSRAEDVDILCQSITHRFATDDLATTDADVTGLLELFAHVTDAHPADKIGHSRRVAHRSVLVAMAMGLPEDVTMKLKWAALVHDVGLVTVPKAILDKPGPLSHEELIQVHTHAVATERFIAPIRGLEEVAAIAAAHGEAFDGSGYPHGLAGNEIPLGARILAVCDTFDALTSHRPYRAARDSSLAIDILIKGSGSLFDPDVVTAAVPVFLITRASDEPAMHALN
jgi:HD-GYP domain-containing protein (c-di-GMP phosphodiesterase class II)